jgi:hypothetical protein
MTPIEKVKEGYKVLSEKSGQEPGWSVRKKK